MYTRSNHTVRGCAAGLLLVLFLTGCGSAAGRWDRPDSVSGGGGIAPVGTTSPATLLQAADTLIASDVHCLHEDPAVGCRGGGTAARSGDSNGAPGNDGMVSVLNDGSTAAGGFGRTVIPLDCAGTICTAEAPHGARISTAGIASLVGRAENAPIGDIGRVPLVEFATSGAAGETTVWGGWLSHVFFAVKADGSRSGGREGPLSGLAVLAVAAGASGPAPASGPATWTGAMVGRSVDPGSGPVWESVRGAAAVTVDFAGREVEVQLTGVTDAYGAAWPVSGIAWSGLVLSPQGVFRDAAGTIEGRFFAHTHGEAAGVFRAHGLVGAFGAMRTR